MTISGATRAIGREAQSATPDAVAPEHLDELIAPGLIDTSDIEEVGEEWFKKAKLVDPTLKNYTDRLIEGAKRYASYDRSDPFTTDRCMAHIRQGICQSINPLRKEVNEDGTIKHVPTGLLWHWDEPIYETSERAGKKVQRDTGRKRHVRTEIIGNAGAPGHYDALVISTVRDGQVELTHRDLRRP